MRLRQINWSRQSIMRYSVCEQGIGAAIDLISRGLFSSEVLLYSIKANNIRTVSMNYMEKKLNEYGYYFHKMAFAEQLIW